MTLERDTIYTYFANKKVYQLINSTGRVFTMQATSRAIAKDQTIVQLEQLGTRLVLPQGWQFTVDVLKEDSYQHLVKKRNHPRLISAHHQRKVAD